MTNPPGPLNPFDPLDLGGLRGEATMRYVTLALPTAQVRTLLPAGVVLGPQTLTPGTHPVLLAFNDIFNLRTSFPSLLPSLTYHEHTVGIPDCYVTSGAISTATPGPYYFMPTLQLDSALAALGGVVYWGYAKRLARITEAGNKYAIARSDGEPMVSLSWDIAGDFRSVTGYPKFTAQRVAISQPLLGLVPLSVGPCFAVAQFPKDWATATIRPLRTVTEVYTDYVTGFPSGRYPTSGESPGIDASIVGSYELRAPWRLSSPYPPLSDKPVAT